MQTLKRNRVLLTLLITFIITMALLFASTLVFAEDEENDASVNLEINFFNHENKHIGDCFIIRYGDIQILVDAGPTSVPDQIHRIKAQIDKSISSDDDVWDYVIVTHPDMDHIAAFSNSGTENFDTGIFKHLAKEGRTIGTLIDFEIEAIK